MRSLRASLQKLSTPSVTLQFEHQRLFMWLFYVVLVYLAFGMSKLHCIPIKGSISPTTALALESIAAQSFFKPRLPGCSFLIPSR
jgi:hypothetical protein